MKFKENTFKLCTKTQTQKQSLTDTHNNYTNFTKVSQQLIICLQISSGKYSNACMHIYKVMSNLSVSKMKFSTKLNSFTFVSMLRLLSPYSNTSISTLIGLSHNSLTF